MRYLPMILSASILAAAATGCDVAPDEATPLATDEAALAAENPAEPSAAAEPEVAAASAITTQAVSCSTHKYHTAGCIDCSGNGQVRIVIDCKAPQITDYVGPYINFNGNVHLCGECNFGINSVSYQAR